MTYCYFLDYHTFEIKDVKQIQDYELSIDEETNAKTTFSLVEKANADDKDYVFIKEDGEFIYQGIIDAPTNEGGTKWTFTAKYISNLFDRKIILSNNALIKTTGIEDFLKYTIENEFTQSSDTLLNLDYIDVVITTHTPKNFTPDTESGIYNFHTFMTNMTQKYNIVYTFEIVNTNNTGNRLKITITSVEADDEILIDCNVSDILNYEETYNVNVYGKVVVLCGDNTTYTLYLKTDRTTTTDADDPDRAIGSVTTLYSELAEDARQTALDQFKGNEYQHLIQFTLNKNTMLFDMSKMKIGHKVKIKNKEGDLIDSYVSALTIKNGSPFIQFKSGNIRIDFIDKLKKERTE